MEISLVTALDNSSFGLHARQLVRHLAKLDIECVIRPSRPVADPSKLPTEVATRIRPGENDCPLEVILGHPMIAPTTGKRTIGLFAWESTRLPAKCVAICNACAAVIVPSNYCATVFSASGVDVPIHVVPLGVSEAFTYQPAERNGHQFIFAAAGNLANGERRKGVQAVIDCFRAAFPTDDVRLNVKLHPHDSVVTFADKRITVEHRWLDESELALWMRAADCFVHFGTGAFELQVLEAMSLGVPVMAMKFGGHADYFQGIEIPFSLCQADGMWSGGRFASPLMEPAVREMRCMVQDARYSQEYLQEQSLRAWSHVADLSWEKHSTRVAAFLELLRPKPVRKTGCADTDALVAYYADREALKKPRREDLFAGHDLTNRPQGIGDVAIMSPIPGAALAAGKDIRIWSPSKFFVEMTPMVPDLKMRDPGSNVPSINVAGSPREESLYRYDCGNGHIIQRIHRAFGLKVPLRPAPRLTPPDFVRMPRRNTVAIHLVPGQHAAWQRLHVHPRAREIYPETLGILRQFIADHPDWTFREIGAKPSYLLPNNVTDSTGLPLALTMEVLAESEFLICIPSGPMHLGAALGVKSIVLLNFPEARSVMLPTLKDLGVVESEWLLPQNVHLHQESEGPLCRRLTHDTLNRAFAGEIYPYWSEKFLPLVNESW